MQQSYTLGIDLGTTFTAAAINTPTNTEMLNLGTAAAAVPSVMVQRQTGWLYGETAAERATQDPLNVARNYKRRIGDPVPIRVAANQIPAEELTAQFFTWVLDKSPSVKASHQPPLG